MIRLAHLTKIYDSPGKTQVRALEDISLCAAKGEFLALTGPSGSGKTTLLFSIAGMITPTSGTVTVAGQEITKLDSSQRSDFRAGNVGFVFQMFYLVPYLTALENVRAAGMARSDTGDDFRKRAEEFLARLGLEERMSHLPSELSAGEQQRVSLARALVNQPAVLLADEPTGNLDGPRAEEIMKLLAEENKRGQTIVLATHSGQVAGRASRQVRLERGRLIA